MSFGASIASQAAAQLAARAAAVIPGGVNSGQRRVAGLEDLVISATSGSTPLSERSRMVRISPSTRRWVGLRSSSTA